MQTEDGSLIYKCLNGEPEAFGLLVDKYKTGIYAFAYAKIGNFHDAQDVTQEVFTRAYRDLRTLRRWESFVFWLYRIASAQCAKWIRMQKRRLDREFIEDQDPTILEANSIDSYRENQLNESLRESLEILPEACRDILTLHYIGGMKVMEISKSLGISPSTIARRLREARLQLREEMLDMMNETFEQNRLRAGFTFHIIETIKKIRINPMPPKTLPWSLSIATGIIIAIMGIGTHINVADNESYMSGSSIGESKVLNVGEYPVDMAKVSNIPVMSNQYSIGNGLSSIVPSLQNALFMAPQAGDTWTKRADMPTARFALSTSAVNGKIYAIGGQAFGAIILSTVEEYDPVTDKWTRKADMPTPRGYLSTSVVNGKIYAIGGYDKINKELSVVEEYDPVIDKWTKKTNMPTPRMNFTTTTANGRIYAIGGWWEVANTELTAVEEYDPSKDKWTRKLDMPTRRQLHSADNVDGKIYVIGGWSRAVISTVEEYDPAKDEWTNKTDVPTARDSLSATAVSGKIYAIGGDIGGKAPNEQNYLSIVEEYDPVSDKWTNKANMPTARNWHSSSELNGKIYVIGGEILRQDLNRIVFSTVEEYDTGTSGQSINFKGKLPTTWGDVKLARNK